MGLDQYAFKIKHKPSKDVDFNEELEGIETKEIHYWRKHPNLHGFMEELYISKGGEDTFNCRPVVLTIEDINKLVTLILNGKLPETSGFFFGKSQGDKREENDDIKFCKEAIKAIKEGYTVYYDSWW